MSRSQAFEICFCFESMFKLRVAEPPDDIKGLFDQYAENGSMSLEQLHKFMMEYQGEKTATIEDAQAVFNGLKLLSMFQRKGLNLDAFFGNLFGEPQFSPPSCEGHNSYLTGNQLNSPSSIEPIISSLNTLTSPVELIKCLEAIKENAFSGSEYPVIITFEDHLDANLQAEVA
ncbi:hypothetical protein Ancab_007407 [Ancistrocladus abbreviatus]